MLRRSLALALFALVAVACGGGTATVANNNTSGELQHQQDGSATGNGATCSWNGTALYASTGQKDATPYSVGATFASLDGCNTCSCTAQGISCTTKACGGGTSSSGGQACQADARICPDGTAQGRSGPNCTFPECPTNTDGGIGIACPDIAKQCPDGTYVGATGPNCEFKCPSAMCESLADKARSELDAVLTANSACEGGDECTTVDYSTDCFSSCFRVINKKGLGAYNDAKKNANANECKGFKDQDCKLTHPPCVAPMPAKCVDHVCQ